MRKLLVTASVLATIAASGWPASAGPRAPGGTLAVGASALSLASAAYGDTVELSATYWNVRRQDAVRVQVLCLQGGSVVYGDNSELTASPSVSGFTLGRASNGTSVWSGGPASCRGDLYVVGGGSRVTQLATVAFEATG